MTYSPKMTRDNVLTGLGQSTGVYLQVAMHDQLYYNLGLWEVPGINLSKIANVVHEIPHWTGVMYGEW